MLDCQEPQTRSHNREMPRMTVEMTKTVKKTRVTGKSSTRLAIARHFVNINRAQKRGSRGTSRIGVRSAHAFAASSQMCSTDALSA